jgi:leader peptidase (prepilin peptidase)/N-methyltransferase
MWFWRLLFGAFGLALGSFGNVLLHRIRTDEPLFGRSKCPQCQYELAWYDLVPALSYLWLRGKCRDCRFPISARYPIVEVLSLGIFLFATFLTPNDPLNGLFTAFVLYFLLLACVFDLEWQQVPDALTILAGVSALAQVLWLGTFVSAIGGAAVGLVWFGGQWIVSRGSAIGTGDIFLGAVLGFWLGWQHAIAMIFLSYMVGAVMILAMLISGRLTFKKTRIAFVPFMGIGTVLAFVGVGDWYLSLF